ncbi:hypothetical protein J7T55_015521 [Diaporthe amygdali]|uniref:uncharacterized protein n=1 Tax=Phomopsis amygdali TaxID=1214568 RepID=UPI0022FEC93F|nr:uncharacterized protein J7T55_015521 [Diaporthe amygdali]KAJ0120787.1 hypothetical protein J7T55_015521 [Diaporthe amygdali]
MATAAYYPVNDTSLSPAERAYLQELTDIAAKQPLEEDKRQEVRNITIIFTVIAVLVVALRCISRLKIKAPFWTDDWLTLATLMLLFGNAAFNFVVVEQGVGLHSGRLNLPQLQALNKTIVGAEVIYLTGVNAYKISLLFLYFRIFPIKSVRIWAYVFGGLSTSWNIAGVFAAAFQCTPRAKIWEPWVEGYCINVFLAQLLKTFLVFMFMSGSYVVFTSIYRFTVYLHYSSKNIPFTLATPVAWNIIEISSGIVSSCLPTLGPIIRPVIKSVMPSTLGKSGNKDSAHIGYERRNGAASRSGLVTIGGGSTHQNNGHWSRLEGSGRHGVDGRGSSALHYDIEMQPRSKITGVDAIKQNQPGYCQTTTITKDADVKSKALKFNA